MFSAFGSESCVIWDSSVMQSLWVLLHVKFTVINFPSVKKKSCFLSVLPLVFIDSHCCQVTTIYKCCKKKKNECVSQTEDLLFTFIFRHLYIKSSASPTYISVQNAYFSRKLNLVLKLDSNLTLCMYFIVVA